MFDGTCKVAYQWIIIIEWNWSILSIWFTKCITAQHCCCDCWCCHWWSQTKDILRFCKTRTIVWFKQVLGQLFSILNLLKIVNNTTDHPIGRGQAKEWPKEKKEKKKKEKEREKRKQKQQTEYYSRCWEFFFLVENLWCYFLQWKFFLLFFFFLDRTRKRRSSRRKRGRRFEYRCYTCYINYINIYYYKVYKL